MSKAVSAATVEVVAHPKTTVDKLQDLLHLLNIKQVYYVDDENNLKEVDVELVAAEIQVIVGAEKIEKLREIQFAYWNLDLPHEEIAPQLRTLWNKIELKEKLDLYQQIHKISREQESLLNQARSRIIEAYFPEDTIKLLSPQEWDAIKDQFASTLSEGDRALILFDEDLHHAGFKYLNRRGQDLIVEVKEKGITDRVLCTLLTGSITSNQELGERTNIISRRQEKDLDEMDFFPLAKERLDNAEFFADGIKKTLINRYFEAIKKHTVDIIQHAYTQAAIQISEYDTYDFEDTILKTSNKEGVWEVNTILRISDIIFENKLKERMVETDYAIKVNKEFEQAYPFANIKFAVPADRQPYSQKLHLRHQEIYDPATVVNSLRKPIENGDIFQISDEKYILVTQACDLMVRAQGPNQGLRNAQTATLFKIEMQSLKEHNDKKKKTDHYLRDKHALPYFTKGSNDVGVVLFTEFLIVDINFLDLCALQGDGHARFNTAAADINTQYLSQSWVLRSAILKQELRKYQAIIEDIIAHTQEIRSVKADQIIRQFYPRFILAKSKNITLSNELVEYRNNTFDFSIKRIGKYKDEGAVYLLDRYTKHLSRVAELHDFASTKN